MLFFLSSGNNEVANGCYCLSAWNQARIFNKAACSLSVNSSKYFSTHNLQTEFSFTDLVEIVRFPVLLIEYSFFFERFKSFKLISSPFPIVLLSSITPFILQWVALNFEGGGSKKNQSYACSWHRKARSSINNNSRNWVFAYRTSASDSWGFG